MNDIIRKIHNLIHPIQGYILMLHRVAQVPNDNYLVITADFLEGSIDFYQQRGFEAISIDEAKCRLANRIKSRFVCYTFDDGYLDTFTLAYPILKSKRIPFCVYLTCDFYQKKATPHWNPDVEMMGVEQILELAAEPLCTLGAHTSSHPHLSRLSIEDQRSELAFSKKDLERIVGKPIRHFAYPYGDYNQQTLRVVKDLGFETAVTTSGCPVRDDASLFELDRVTLIQSK